MGIRASILFKTVFCLFTAGLFTPLHGEPVTLQAPDCMQIMIRVMQASRMGQSMAAIESDSLRIASNGISPSNKNLPLRSKMVATMNDPAMRANMRVAAYSDLHSVSDRILAGLETARESGKIDPAVQVYDVIGVGAGPHDLISMMAIKDQKPALKVLTIEATGRVGQVFDKKGFRLNSLNRPGQVDTVQRKGIGNQNELPGGLVQIPDFAPGAYPIAKDLADTILMNRALIPDAPVVFGTKVELVEDSKINGDQWPARYRVTTDRGAFYANAIVHNSGLGTTPKLDSLPQQTQMFVATERVKLTENKMPRVMLAADYFDLMERNPEAFANVAGKTVAVVGAGDSANTVIEHLLGLGPENSYGISSAQQGRIREAIWLGQSNEDCDEFLNNTRVRYSDIAGGIKAEIIKPTSSRLSELTATSGGQVKVGIERERSQTVDLVILATGFEDRSADPYRKILIAAKNLPDSDTPLRDSKGVKVVTGRISGLGTTAIGKVLEGPQEVDGKPIPKQQIYFNGPAAGGLVKEAELRNVKENAVSLFNTGPRTRANGQAIAKSLRPIRVPRFTPAGMMKLTKKDLNRISDSRGYRLKSSPQFTNYDAAATLNDLLLKATVAAAFSPITVEGIDTIKIGFDKSAEDGVVLTFSTPLSQKAQEQIAQILQQMPGLTQNLEKTMGQDSHYKHIEVALSFSNGRVDLINSSINFFATRRESPRSIVQVETSNFEKPELVLNPADGFLQSQIQNAGIRKKLPLDEIRQLRNLNANQVGFFLSALAKRPRADILSATNLLAERANITESDITKVAEYVKDRQGATALNFFLLAYLKNNPFQTSSFYREARSQLDNYFLPGQGTVDLLEFGAAIAESDLTDKEFEVLARTVFSNGKDIGPDELKAAVKKSFPKLTAKQLVELLLAVNRSCKIFLKLGDYWVTDFLEPLLPEVTDLKANLVFRISNPFSDPTLAETAIEAELEKRQNASQPKPKTSKKRPPNPRSEFSKYEKTIYENIREVYEFLDEIERIAEAQSKRRAK